MNRLIVALALVLAGSLPAYAQQLKLHIQDGRVTLDATSVPARQILAEWARVGGTKVVGAEKITGAPLTLKLKDMPERQALDIVLRNVAGFMAAPRQASAAPGASAYDRILILATSTVPAPTAANPPAGGRYPQLGGPPGAGNPAPGNAGMRIPPRPANLPPSPAVDEADEADEDAADPGLTTPVFTFPSPPGSTGNPVFAPMPNGGAPGNQMFVPIPNGSSFGRPGQPGTFSAPVINLQPNENGQPTIYNFVPNVEGTTAPTTGFSVVGSPRPGMIQLPPPTPVPQAPPGSVTIPPPPPPPPSSQRPPPK